MLDRFDPMPLFEVAAFSVGMKPPSFEKRRAADEIKHEDLARLVGVSTRTISRWHHCGMTVEAVESAAHKLGRHPADIYGFDNYYRAAQAKELSGI